MKKLRIATFLTLVIFASIVLYSNSVFATSLWNDDSVSLYTKQPSAYQVGDLITIIIVEQATAIQKAESSNGEDGSIGAREGTGILDFLPSLGASWDTEYKGKGSTTRGGSLNARLTVSVVDVTPEGILVIEGRQVIKVNKEDQILTIKGKIRPEDIAGGNTVYSTYVADAVIEYEGKGVVGRTQDPGVLTKFFQWLF